MWPLLLFLGLSRSEQSATNQFVESVGPNGESVWQSTSDFVPVQGESFGAIKLGHDMVMEFDFVFNGRTNSPIESKFEMFFRIGFDAKNGNNCNGHNSRYPSFWLKDTEPMLFLSVSSGPKCATVPKDALSEYGTISRGVPHHVVIAFNDSSLSFQISGGGKADFAERWEREPTPSHHIGAEAPIWWMSTKFGQTEYNRANGTFSNILILSKQFGVAAMTTESAEEPTESVVQFGYYGGRMVYITVAIMIVLLVCCCTICVCRERWKF